MTPDVDVVIVAHNAGPLLVDAVGSVAGQVGERRIWVMDAQSSDESVARVLARYPDINVIEVPNAGFSASNNRGIEATSGEYVLLLNPDAALAAGAVDALIRTEVAERSGGRIAVVAPLVVNPDGSAQANSYGRFPTLLVQLGIHARRAMARLARVPATPKRPTTVVEPDWVTGACMLVRRDAIRDAGLMDEGFFLYYEDVEWCHRFRDHGWRVLLQPAVTCVHHLGQSGAPSKFVRAAYRDSLDRYTRLYGLPGLRVVARLRSRLGRAS